MTKQVYKLGFQCPINGTPCIAIYDNQAGVLMFQLEDYVDTIHRTEMNDIAEAFEWCNKNQTICSNISMANQWLAYLNIKDRLWEGGAHHDDELYM